MPLPAHRMPPKPNTVIEQLNGPSSKELLVEIKVPFLYQKNSRPIRSMSSCDRSNIMLNESESAVALIVEFANHMRRQGATAQQAVIEASTTRLRPILMTTVATMAGHFPLVLVSGAGAAARNSIGLVLVGGMGIGTLFTLFVVPALYLLFSRQSSTMVESTDPAKPASQLV